MPYDYCIDASAFQLPVLSAVDVSTVPAASRILRMNKDAALFSADAVGCEGEACGMTRERQAQRLVLDARSDTD